MKLILLGPVLLMILLPRRAAAADRPVVTAEERSRIEQAVPRQPVVKPARPRRLLVFTLNVGYAGHPSIAHANEAFTLMGRATGAFETVISNDPTVFARESLGRFDAVFFNNTVGNLFTDPLLRQNLLEFVTGGGGLLGVHGSSVAFCRWPGAVEDWPEFGFLLGARGVTHKDADEPVMIKLDDPAHPLVRPFDGDFEYRSEFFRYKEPYSRERVRVLLSIDTVRTDFSLGGRPRGVVTRPDNDYALAWIRHYGRGRVFYSTIGHAPEIFRDPKMLAFYLAGTQFALGDLVVPTTPSARLTPAVRAQEKLGWKLGVEAYTFHKFTFFETIEKTAQLGLPYVGGLSFQKVSRDNAKNFDPSLADDELRDIRLKLEHHGLRLMTYYIQDIPRDEAACRRIFEFGRKMGIEMFLSEPKPEALEVIDRFCAEYGINVALHNHGPKQSPQYWSPEGVLQACRGRSRRIGACADVGYWIRSGLDPVGAVRQLGDRLLVLQLHDLHATGPEGHDVPWGTGAGRTADVLRELHRQGVRPAMIGLEYSHDWFESVPQIARSIDFFNTTVLSLVR